MTKRAPRRRHSAFAMARRVAPRSPGSGNGSRGTAPCRSKRSDCATCATACRRAPPDGRCGTSRTGSRHRCRRTTSRHGPPSPRTAVSDQRLAFDNAHQLLPRCPVNVRGPQPRTQHVVAADDVQRQVTAVVPRKKRPSWLPCSGAPVLSKSSFLRRRSLKEQAEDRPSPSCRPSCTGQARRACPAQAGSGASGWPRSRSRTRFSPVRSSPASASKLSSRSLSWSLRSS